MICCKSTPKARYFSQISNCTTPKEMHILCAIWNLSGSCGLQKMVNGRPLEDSSDLHFRSSEECKVVAHNVRALWLL